MTIKNKRKRMYSNRIQRGPGLFNQIQKTSSNFKYKGVTMEDIKELLTNLGDDYQEQEKSTV